jgi:hypothetical protein
VTCLILRGAGTSTGWRFGGGVSCLEMLLPAEEESYDMMQWQAASSGPFRQFRSISIANKMRVGHLKEH